MNLDNVDKGLDQADSILSKLKIVLRKHWGILILILFISLGYYVFTSDEFVEDEIEYIDDAEYTDEGTESEYVEDSTIVYEDEEYVEE